MNVIARWAAYNAPLFGLLAAGIFYRAEWAMGIAVFLVWSISMIALLGCSVPNLRERLSANDVEVAPKPLRMISSAAIAALLAAGGWFISAAIWAAAATAVSVVCNSGKSGKAANER